MKVSSTSALFMAAIAPMLAAADDPLDNIPGGPCAIVDCQPGFSVFGRDKHGCGGHCIQMSSSQMKSALAVFTAKDVNADGNIPPGAAYSALSQLASQWHMSPTEKQIDSYSKKAGKTVKLAEFLQMCKKMIDAFKPKNCKACVAASGAWTPSTRKCTFNSQYRGYGDVQYHTRDHCDKDAAAHRAGCGRYKSCQDCVKNGKDKKLGALCAWIDADAPFLMGGRALRSGAILSSPSGKCQPATIVFHFGGQMEKTSVSQCAVKVEG